MRYAAELEQLRCEGLLRQGQGSVIRASEVARVFGTRAAIPAFRAEAETHESVADLLRATEDLVAAMRPLGDDEVQVRSEATTGRSIRYRYQVYYPLRSPVPLAALRFGVGALAVLVDSDAADCFELAGDRAELAALARNWPATPAVFLLDDQEIAAGRLPLRLKAELKTEPTLQLRFERSVVRAGDKVSIDAHVHRCLPPL